MVNGFEPHQEEKPLEQNSLSLPPQFLGDVSKIDAFAAAITTTSTISSSFNTQKRLDLRLGNPLVAGEPRCPADEEFAFRDAGPKTRSQKATNGNEEMTLVRTATKGDGHGGGRKVVCERRKCGRRQLW